MRGREGGEESEEEGERERERGENERERRRVRRDGEREGGKSVMDGKRKRISKNAGKEKYIEKDIQMNREKDKEDKLSNVSQPNLTVCEEKSFL